MSSAGPNFELRSSAPGCTALLQLKSSSRPTASLISSLFTLLILIRSHLLLLTITMPSEFKLLVWVIGAADCNAFENHYQYSQGSSTC